MVTMGMGLILIAKALKPLKSLKSQGAIGASRGGLVVYLEELKTLDAYAAKKSIVPLLIQVLTLVESLQFLCHLRLAMSSLSKAFVNRFYLRKAIKTAVDTSMRNTWQYLSIEGKLFGPRLKTNFRSRGAMVTLRELKASPKYALEVD
jgi:ribosomal protein S3